MNKFKYNYVSNVYDVKHIKTFNTNEEYCDYMRKEHSKSISEDNYDRRDIVLYKGEKVILKEFSNNREMFFCSCGNSFDIKTNLRKNVTPSNPVVYCKNCKQLKTKNTIRLHSRLDANINNLNYYFFEDEKKVKIVKFEEFVGINMYSKKIFKKEYTSSLSFNKNTKRIYLYNSRKKHNKVISLGLYNLHNCLHNFFAGAFYLKSKSCTMPQNPNFIIKNKETALLKPFNSFLNSITKFIDERDVNRVSNYLHKLESKETGKINKDSFESYIDSVYILLSIIQYPHLCNILFNKGIDFYKSTLLRCPSLSYFPKQKPTSPIEITKEIIISSIKHSNKMHRREANFYPNMNDRLFEKIKKNNSTIKEYRKIKIPKYIYKKITEDYYLNKLSLPTSAIHTFISYYLSIINKNIMTKEDIIDLIEKFGLYNVELCVSNLSDTYTNDGFIFEIHDNNLKNKIKHFLNLKDNEPYSELFIEHNEISERAHIYRDLCNMLIMRNQPLEILFKIKTWDGVVELHDEITSLINLEKIEKFNEGIKEHSKNYNHIKNYKTNNVSFTLIDNVQLLEEESRIMKHCVKSYANGLSEGRHLLFSVKDEETKERATLEFRNISKQVYYERVGFTIKSEEKLISETDIWKFSQLKAKYNNKTTQKIVDALKVFCDEFLVKNNIKHIIDFDTNHDLNLSSKKINYGLEPDFRNQRMDDLFYEELDDDLPF